MLRLVRGELSQERAVTAAVQQGNESFKLRQPRNGCVPGKTQA